MKPHRTAIVLLYTLLICVLLTTSSQRKGRQNFGLFSIVTFPNLPCRGANNLNGTCVSGSECQGSGGQAQGPCAQGFGTCCYYFMNTCGGDVTKNQTYLQNPGYPGTYTVSSTTTCTYNIKRLNSDVCQVRFDFEHFDLGPPFTDVFPVKMECKSTGTDYVTFTPAGGKTNNLELCGYNPGQHVYIDMGTTNASPNDVVLNMKFDSTKYASYQRKYNIMVSQIECNTLHFAPIGCDQYFFGNNGFGTITHFNYDQPTALYEGRLKGKYTMCVRREKGKSMISYTPPDVSVDDRGFSVSGNLERANLGCKGTTMPGLCKVFFLRIPQGTSSGNRPFFCAARIM